MDPLHATPVYECLDIAVDHRLRKLFLPVSKEEASIFTGAHLRQIFQIGLSLRRRDGPVPRNEIKVTRQLALPGSVGGILIMLLQPANTQPFDLGVDITIQECRTFAALHEGFCAVTCNSLGIPDITVIDSLPFIRPKDEVSPQLRRQLRMQVFEIVKAKRPDVILCMWQDKNGVTEDMELIRSIGIGRRFSEPRVQLEHDFTANRVNAFHPSYTIYHNPNFSCFRQLLLLEIAQACHTYMGNWVEQEWMAELREKCRGKASDLSTVSDRDLAYFTNCLKVNLEPTKTSIISQAENETLKHQTALTSYDWLLRMRISEHCNDTSLNLGEIWLQHESMHQDDMSQKDKSAISGAVTACVQFLMDIVLSIQSKTLVPLNRTREARGLYIQKDMASLLSRQFHHGTPGHSEFARIVPDFLKALNSSFEPAPGQKYNACLGEISKLFLEFAVSIEKLLGQLTAEGKGKGSSKMTGTDEAIMELTEGMKTVAITKVSILSTIGVAEPLLTRSKKSITSELDNADESFFDMIKKMNMDDGDEEEGEEEDE